MQIVLNRDNFIENVCNNCFAVRSVAGRASNN